MTSPDALPIPSRFAHLDPDDGACLMELASVLAGAPFCDDPPTTHPALAALARTVNDTVGDRARRSLAPLAADLATAYPADRRYGPELVTAALDAALLRRPGSLLLRRRRDRCRRRAQRLASARPAARGRTGLADRLWWRGPGVRCLEHAVRVLAREDDADALLTGLLTDALRAARTPAAAPAAPVRPCPVGDR
ncbi:hypothetical protein ACWGB8_05770 [Kitasatospora sp. NPDC054939]